MSASNRWWNHGRWEREVYLEDGGRAGIWPHAPACQVGLYLPRAAPFGGRAAAAYLRSPWEMTVE